MRPCTLTGTRQDAEIAASSKGSSFSITGLALGRGAVIGTEVTFYTEINLI
ncbi:MAG TPA: hypothetical protein GXZ27_05085 [Thermoanaerobacterales bacterium]|nr:hypothetical protein [Thermoanaerobacterales bacterium]